MKNTCLIVIDVQNDFCSQGSLAIPDGEKIVPLCNKLMSQYNLVVCSQDWHCEGHLSFASSNQNAANFSEKQMTYGKQILWPDHCVQGTNGAKFHPDLNIDKTDLIIRKGMNKNIDSYSAFYENNKTTKTGLDGFLKDKGIVNTILCGLAFDFCVCWTALDAVKCGYNVQVVSDACKSTDTYGSYDNAVLKMKAAGVKIVNANSLTN